MGSGNLENMKGERAVVGFEQFLQTFGDVTLSKIIVIVLAIVFLFGIYKQIKKFLDNKKKVLIEKHEAEKIKDEQLQKVLEEVNKYPQYREQSRQIQKQFREEIDGVKESQQRLAESQQEIIESIKDMRQKQEKRERNKLRDKLVQLYRYYTDEKRNPEQTWTKMESEAFWELFRDYEDMNGDGYIHTVVQPAMDLLKVIDIL